MQGYPGLKSMGSVARAAVLSSALFACTPRADSPGWGLADQTSPPRPEIISTVVDARPAALINGQLVEWGELRPLLNEAAGARVLQEVVLDRMVSKALAEAGLTISQIDAEAEQRLLRESLSDDPNVAIRLERELRARQGLGRHRLARLLKRNASLRAMVRDGVEVTDEAVRRRYELVHGPKRQGRVIVVPTLAEALRAINRVKSGERFADVVVEVSTDTSAARGGLLEPMSRHDPSYPQAMRKALWALAPGGMSPAVLLGTQYAVVTLVRELKGDGTRIDDVRPRLERQVRLSQERLLMDQLARHLLADAAVTIIDDALQQSWEKQERRIAETQ